MLYGFEPENDLLSKCILTIAQVETEMVDGILVNGMHTFKRF